MPADRFTRGIANVVPGEEHAASRVKGMAAGMEKAA